jgi:Flp pilus assembly protein TadD
VRGRRDEAVAAFEAALSIDPDYAQAHNNLGALLHLLGRLDRAEEHYRRAIALRADNVEAHGNLGLLLSAQGRTADAVHELQAALAQSPDQPQALAGLAWIRATSPDAAFRNGAEAVALARRAVELTETKDVASLDALAAAYAEAGQFDDAVLTARTGVEVAAASGSPDVTAQFRLRLQMYQRGLTYRSVGSKKP